MQSFLVGTLGLTLALVAAVALTIARPRIAADAAARRRAALVAGAALLAQGAHFAEEMAGGFAARFPEIVGLEPWPDRLFVGFNLVWIAIWIVSIVGVRTGVVAALVPLWFLALAAVANLVVHPLLALRAGNYFPGLVTAPLLGLAGLALARELVGVTREGST